jgi:hypothetical protein
MVMATKHKQNLGSTPPHTPKATRSSPWREIFYPPTYRPLPISKRTISHCFSGLNSKKSNTGAGPTPAHVLVPATHAQRIPPAARGPPRHWGLFSPTPRGWAPPNSARVSRVSPLQQPPWFSGIAGRSTQLADGRAPRGALTGVSVAVRAASASWSGTRSCPTTWGALPAGAAGPGDGDAPRSGHRRARHTFFPICFLSHISFPPSPDRSISK